MAKIIQVTIENFQTELMQEAENRPVVLTFASSQMPDCASYNAILEKLSSELDFTLGEVNLDIPENMAFVQTFRLQSLPFVVVLHNGQMEDAIQGKLSEDELKKRLSKFFISDEDRAKQEAEDAIAEGNFAAAKPILEGLIAKTPNEDHFKVLLAKCELGMGDPEKSKEILKQISNNSAEYANAKSLLDLMDLLVEAAKTDSVEGDAKAFREACKDAERKDYRSALEGFFHLALSNPDFKDGAAKKSMLILFGVLGPKDPLTWEYRSKLNTFLFI
ncbi:tetratricopeptide repeat protein [Hallerella succinigenes]|uniref:Thioredoxin n=1 Tax=Hallerella succinigenes TaxID=1896222 RepID=A0A2M9A6E2_9BACT|nr:tetratricopeptide repeat protein [Hallerella succinigenes]PJJ41269.1 thioredoxin [Hallerella succinigenes]